MNDMILDQAHQLTELWDEATRDEEQNRTGCLHQAIVDETIYEPCGGNVYTVREPGAERHANARRLAMAAVRTTAVCPPDRERRKARHELLRPCGKAGTVGGNSRWRSALHDARARTGHEMRADR